MGHKVARCSRGKSGGVAVASGGNDERIRPSRGRSHGSSTTPSRKREGSKARGAAGPRIKSGIRERENPLMPGLRIREDGWTEARTRTFLAVLAQTGCVTDAARIAGVSTTSVNRSRGLFPPFDKACVEALANALRGLEAVAYQRAVVGRETVIYRGGKEYERRIMPSDNLLRLLIKRGDLTGALGRALSPAEAEAFVLPEAVRHRFIDRAEFESGIVFERGVKRRRRIATQEETDALLMKRILMIGEAKRRAGRAEPRCETCGQIAPLTDAEWDTLHEEWGAVYAATDAQGRLLPPPD